MKKRWECHDLITPETHFYSDPTPWNSRVLIPRLKNGEWLLLVGSTLCGKKTRILALKNQLRREGFNAI